MGVYTEAYNSVDELANVTITNFEEHTSLLDDTLTSFAEGESNWNKIMESIAVNELAVLESTGEEMIYEADEQKSFFDKIIKWFKDRWADICGIFKKFYSKLQEFTDFNKKFATKNKDVIKDGANNIPADGIKVKGHKFENLDSINYDVDVVLNPIKSNSNYQKAMGTLEPENISNVKELINSLKEERSGILDTARGSVMNNSKGNCESKEFVKNLKEYLYGTAFETYHGDSEMKISDVIDSMIGATAAKNTAKRAYNELKAEFNKAIKEVKDVQKSCKKDGKSESQSIRMAFANEVINQLKGVIGVYHQANGVHLQAIGAKATMCKAIAVKCVKYSKKAKKGSKDETVSTGESAYLESESFNDLFNLELM